MLVFGGVPETPPSLPPTGRFLRDEQLKNSHSVVDGPWPQKINPRWGQPIVQTRPGPPSHSVEDMLMGISLG